MGLLLPNFMIACEDFVEHSDNTYSIKNGFMVKKISSYPQKITFKLVCGFDYNPTPKKK
ncbi:hypothetical protein OYT88_11965 [Sporolactobacillus sp. CQH2019]|uniref:hypothetical protein n=1 Tax=Sporolactobacillus sp. CQH2019 TaxID=3023512 RepID=UPI002368D38B|nr:hypothetical protein [Sporolactobacillus sp. CQH2019]MDD9149270.1 hypothetical protein [Sporolactobacillus sp. CQH2019]